MTAAEFSRWLDYFQRVGRCGPVRMFDRGPAMLACKLDHTISSDATSTVEDYLPYKPAATNDEPTPEEVMRELFGKR